MREEMRRDETRLPDGREEVAAYQGAQIKSSEGLV